MGRNRCIKAQKYQNQSVITYIQYITQNPKLQWTVSIHEKANPDSLEQRLCDLLASKKNNKSSTDERLEIIWGGGQHTYNPYP